MIKLSEVAENLEKLKKTKILYETEPIYLIKFSLSKISINWSYFYKTITTKRQNNTSSNSYYWLFSIHFENFQIFWRTVRTIRIGAHLSLSELSHSFLVSHFLLVFSSFSSFFNVDLKLCNIKIILDYVLSDKLAICHGIL